MTELMLPDDCGYKKIWFDEDELENFDTYDENGDKL